MLMRIELLYNDRRSVPICLGLLWCVQLAVNAWLLTYGQRAYLTFILSNYLNVRNPVAVMHNRFSGVHGQRKWFLLSVSQVHGVIQPAQ